jgi:hypothetical protein
MFSTARLLQILGVLVIIALSISAFPRFVRNTASASASRRSRFNASVSSISAIFSAMMLVNRRSAACVSSRFASCPLYRVEQPLCLCLCALNGRLSLVPALAG